MDVAKSKLLDRVGGDSKELKALIISTVNEQGALIRAATALDVTPNALQYQMKKFNLIAVRTEGRTVLIEKASA